MYNWCFMRKSDAKESKGVRGYRAAALTSVTAKWYVPALVQRWQRDRTAGMEESACGKRNGVGCTADEPSTKTLGMAAVVPTQDIDHSEKCGCE